MPPSKAALAKIHIAKKELGLTDEMYRDLLFCNFKVESAKENASEAMESLGEAAKDTGAAIEQKTDEVLGKEPTTGEKVEDAAGKAADAIEEAGDEAKDAIDAQ